MITISVVFLSVITPYNLVYGYRPFAVIYCLCLQANQEVLKGLLIHTITNVPDNTMSLPCKRRDFSYTILPTYQTTRWHYHLNVRPRLEPYTQILTVRHSQAVETSASRERTQWLSFSWEDHPHWPVCRFLQATEVTLLQSVPSCFLHFLLNFLFGCSNAGC